MGGDIIANKKTFLLIHALEAATPTGKKELLHQLQNNAPDKVEKVTAIFLDCGVDAWAMELKEKYLEEALLHLEDIAVLSKRKEELKKLAAFLMMRES
ncbi:MAG: hypothetical protein V4676_02410 [Bacteroidota bacterium]